MGKEEPAAAGLKIGVALGLLALWTCLVLIISFPAWEATLNSSLLSRQGLAAALKMISSRASSGAGIIYAIRQHLSHACMTAVLHAVQAGAGLGVIRWLIPGFVPGWLFAWGAGFGAISLLALGLGLAGLFAPVPVILGSLILAAAGLGEYWGARKSWPSLPGGIGILGPRRSFLERAFIFAGALAVGILFLLASAPDTSWDAVVYHLRLPAFFIQEHRIFHMPTHHFTSFPLGSEMLFSWLMLLGGLEYAGGGESARLFHLSCAVLAAICAGRIGRRLAGPAGGALAGTLLLLSPFTGTIAIRAYNDFAQAALAGLILLSALEKPKGFARLAGLLAGVAISAKYTAVLFFIPLAVLWLRFNWTAYLAWSFAFLPWLAKNYLLTGNPVAPFFSGLFSSGSETCHQFASYLESVAGMSMNPRALGWGTLELLRGHAGESLSELLPVLVAGAALLPIRGRHATAIWRFSALFFGLWIVFSPAIRFFTPALVPLCAIAGRGYLQIEGAFGKFWPRVLVFLFITANLARLPVSHCQLFDPARFVLGKQTASEYVAERLYPIPFYGPTAEWINANISEDSRLLCLLDIKAHYIWRRVIHDFQYVQPGVYLRWLRSGDGMRGLLRKLKQEGITHLLVVRQRARDVGKHYAWREKELAQTAEFLAYHTRPLVSNEEMEILAISSQALPRRSVEKYSWMLFMHPENLIVDGRDAEAVKLLEATLAAVPWLPDARAFLGIAYARLRLFAEAERFLVPASLESGQAAGQAALVLGQLRLMQHRTLEAEQALRRALSLQPDLPEAHFALGMLLYEEGRKDEGRRHVSRAVKLNPRNRNWAGWLARLSSP